MGDSTVKRARTGFTLLLGLVVYLAALPFLATWPPMSGFASSPMNSILVVVWAFLGMGLTFSWSKDFGAGIPLLASLGLGFGYLVIQEFLVGFLLTIACLAWLHRLGKELGLSQLARAESGLAWLVLLSILGVSSLNPDQMGYLFLVVYSAVVLYFLYVFSTLRKTCCESSSGSREP